MLEMWLICSGRLYQSSDIIYVTTLLQFKENNRDSEQFFAEERLRILLTFQLFEGLKQSE
jgi:hypothetical protein